MPNDDTNATREAQVPLIAIRRGRGARIVAIDFEPRVGRWLVWNRGREGKERVPEAAIFITRKKLVPSSHDEAFDGIRVAPAAGAS